VIVEEEVWFVIAPWINSG